MFYDFFSSTQAKVFSAVNCTMLKKNHSTFQIITKALIHNGTVKFISQVDKMLTVNNTQEKNVCVCMTFGRRDNIMAKLCT